MMKYMYWESFDEIHLLKLQDSERWYLHCGMDAFENAHVLIGIGGEEYPIFNSSDEFKLDWPTLEGVVVMEYYCSLVREVYEIVKKDSDAYIDFVLLKEKIL